MCHWISAGASAVDAYLTRYTSPLAHPKLMDALHFTFSPTHCLLGVSLPGHSADSLCSFSVVLTDESSSASSLQMERCFPHALLGYFTDFKTSTYLILYFILFSTNCTIIASHCLNAQVPQMPLQTEHPCTVLLFSTTKGKWFWHILQPGYMLSELSQADSYWNGLKSQDRM